MLMVAFCLATARVRRKAKAITVGWICPIVTMFTLLASSMAIDEEELEIQTINEKNSATFFQIPILIKRAFLSVGLYYV
jgi:hypothetical protein